MHSRRVRELVTDEPRARARSRPRGARRYAEADATATVTAAGDCAVVLSARSRSNADAKNATEPSQLVEKSLVHADPSRHGARRYRLLETVGAYARERLARRGDAELLAQRHAEYFVDLAERADQGMRGPLGGEWLASLEVEQANLRVALSWTSSREAAVLELRLVRALAAFWMERGYWSEGLHWLRHALGRPAAAPATAWRAYALRGAAIIAVHANDFGAAQRWLEEAAHIARELQVSGPVGALGFLKAWQGEHAAARALLEEDLELARRTADGYFETWALRSLGGLALAEGDATTARTYFGSSARLLREMSDGGGLGMSLQGLGDAARAQADYPRARKMYEESLTWLERRGSRAEIRSLLQNLASVACREGDQDRARQLPCQSLAMFVEQGEKRGQAECLVGLGGVALAIGDAEKAARYFGAAEMLLSDIQADLSPLSRSEYEQDRRAVRSALGDGRFAAAAREGGAMRVDELLLACGLAHPGG